MVACPCSAFGNSTGHGMPMMPLRKFPPLKPTGFPKPMLYANRVQTTSVMANAYSTMRAELSAHLRFIRPAYRMARPGTLCSPTNVAAVSCQALSPAFSQFGPDVMSRNIKRVVLPKPRDEALRTGTRAVHRIRVPTARFHRTLQAEETRVIVRFRSLGTERVRT